MSVLSNFDIIAICDFLHIPLVGVFFKDQLPKTKKEGYYIVNLESEPDPGFGSHWVCFYISKKKNRSFYFDSFGVKYAPKLITEYIKEFKPYYNDDQVQRIEAQYCGWYCIAVCYDHNTHPNESAKVLLNRFTAYLDNPKTNYNKLLSFFRRIQ